LQVIRMNFISDMYMLSRNLISNYLYILLVPFVLIITSVALLDACTEPSATLPYYHTASFTPLWAGETKVSLDTIHTIAPFKFTDQEGKTITNATLKGKIYVANFFFTRCGSICPKMTSNLQAVAGAFSNNSNVMLVSHTVKPWEDNPAALKEYAKTHKINSRQWLLLTGSQDEIYNLARTSYFVEEEPGFSKDATEFLHTEHSILVDKKGRIRGIYNTTVKLEIKRMIEDINTLLKQKN